MEPILKIKEAFESLGLTLHLCGDDVRIVPIVINQNRLVAVVTYTSKSTFFKRGWLYIVKPRGQGFETKRSKLLSDKVLGDLLKIVGGCKSITDY